MSSEIVIGERRLKVYENRFTKLIENYDKITGSLKSEIIEEKEYKIYVETDHLLQPEHILYLDKPHGLFYTFSREPIIDYLCIKLYLQDVLMI